MRLLDEINFGSRCLKLACHAVRKVVHAVLVLLEPRERAQRSNDPF